MVSHAPYGAATSWTPSVRTGPVNCLWACRRYIARITPGAKPIFASRIGSPLSRRQALPRRLVPEDGLLQPFFQRRFRLEAQERLGAGHVQTAARLTVRLGRVVADLPL